MDEIRLLSAEGQPTTAVSAQTRMGVFFIRSVSDIIFAMLLPKQLADRCGPPVVCGQQFYKHCFNVHRILNATDAFQFPKSILLYPSAVLPVLSAITPCSRASSNPPCPWPPSSACLDHMLSAILRTCPVTVSVVFFMYQTHVVRPFLSDNVISDFVVL
jgi:hypothetical protein